MGPFAGVGEFAFFDVLFIHFPNRVYWVLLKTLKFYFLCILDIRIGHMEFFRLIFTWKFHIKASYF